MNHPGLGGSYVGYWSGTQNANRGLHWVGEHGPELMYFNGGESVYSAGQSARMINTAPAINVPSVSRTDGSEDFRKQFKDAIKVEVTSVMDGRKVGYGSAKYVSQKNEFEDTRTNRIGGIL